MLTLPEKNPKIETIKDQFMTMTSDLMKNVQSVSPSNVDGNLIKEIRKNVDFIFQNF